MDREERGGRSGGTGWQIGRNGVADREGQGVRSGEMKQRIGRDGAADREARGGGSGGVGRDGSSQAERFVLLGFSGYLLLFNRR